MVARELGMAQKVEVSQEMDPDDVDRWAFYFKIKELAALDSIEAKMFWLLLDETHGDDYGCFFLHSFQAPSRAAGPRRRAIRHRRAGPELPPDVFTSGGGGFYAKKEGRPGDGPEEVRPRGFGEGVGSR